ncbi:MAG: DEAD/DEAH box helicase [Deltaproteobacteria bacterium]|nr:DEAD/DEAH box helicase [Deltaproteobacteria bacterium]
MVGAWAESKTRSDGFTLNQVLPPRAAKTVALPEGLLPGVRQALASRGITELYTHQRVAFDFAVSGRDVVVATPTASGKSLCYNLPVLDRLSKMKDARALFLFPTKALARDQEVALREMMDAAGIEGAAITYDGDTPPDARRAARHRSGVLLTNPDMLHAGVLPHHTAWARFFANLHFVVIDELHMYRGIFGSHLANVVRRLLRVAQFHGSAPIFLTSSATIGNPTEHASRLLGREVALVDESGAPTGPRRVMVYNPPIVNRALGMRASYVKSAVGLAADLVRAGVSTLVFGQSRNQVEVMLKYLRDALDEAYIDDASIQGYRGGYLPDTRRRIEQGLRAGEVRCVVATNALELGIDIGALDAVVCAGYPGSLAALWQRFGRSGRRQEESLALFVASSQALDQYFAGSPQEILDAPVEQARIDPDNVEILVQHLKCAAFELPFEEGEAFGNVPEASVHDALEFLAQHQVLHAVQGRGERQVYHWSGDVYPANQVSLRNVGWDNFAIIDVELTKTIAEMDFRSTHTMLHEQAIYQHDGRQYQVERLDYENHKAFVRRVEPDYYTTALTNVRVSVLEEEAHDRLDFGNGVYLMAGLGVVNVVEKVIGFKKIKFHTHENIGYGEVQLPEIQKPTTAFWLTIPEDVLERTEAPRAVVMDALNGVGHALHMMGAIGLMTDPRDLGRTLVDEPAIGEDLGRPSEIPGVGRPFEPTLYIYDTVAGGIGLAPRLFVERRTLLRRAGQLVARCRCEDGCPACIGPRGAMSPSSPRSFSHKPVVLRLLGLLGLSSDEAPAWT